VERFDFGLEIGKVAIALFQLPAAETAVANRTSLYGCMTMLLGEYPTSATFSISFPHT
jgi:hypothetical protein